MSEATHTVKHPKLYLAVKGKLQHVPAGTNLVLSEKVAKGLGKKVESLTEKQAVKLEAPTVDVKQLEVDLQAATDALNKAKEAKKSEKELKVLEAAVQAAGEALVNVNA